MPLGGESKPLCNYYRGERGVHHTVPVGVGCEFHELCVGAEREGVRIRGIGSPLGGSGTTADSGTDAASIELRCIIGIHRGPRKAKAKPMR
jgi:hypothetical protein